MVGGLFCLWVSGYLLWTPHQLAALGQVIAAEAGCQLAPLGGLQPADQLLQQGAKEDPLRHHQIETLLGERHEVEAKLGGSALGTGPDVGIAAADGGGQLPLAVDLEGALQPGQRLALGLQPLLQGALAAGPLLAQRQSSVCLASFGCKPRRSTSPCTRRNPCTITHCRWP